MSWSVFEIGTSFTPAACTWRSAGVVSVNGCHERMARTIAAASSSLRR